MNPMEYLLIKISMSYFTSQTKLYNYLKNPNNTHIDLSNIINKKLFSLVQYRTNIVSISVCVIDEYFFEDDIKKFINNNRNTLKKFYLKTEQRSLCTKKFAKIIELLYDIKCQYMLVFDATLNNINYDDMDFETVETNKIRNIHISKNFLEFYREKGYKSDIDQVRKFNQHYLLTAFCESLDMTLIDKCRDSYTDPEYNECATYYFNNTFEYLDENKIQMISYGLNNIDQEHELIQKLCNINFEKVNKDSINHDRDYPIPRDIPISRSAWDEKIIKPIVVDSANRYNVKLNNLFFANYDFCMDKLVNMYSLNISMDAFNLSTNASPNLFASKKLGSVCFKTIHQIISNNKTTLKGIIIDIKALKKIIDLAELDNIILLLKEIDSMWRIEISCWFNDFSCEYICNNANESEYIKVIKISDQYKELYREKGYLSTQKKFRRYYYWFAFIKWITSHTNHFSELEPSGYGDISYEFMNEKMHEYQKKERHESERTETNIQFLNESSQKNFLDENYIDIKQPYSGEFDIFTCLQEITNIQSIKTEINPKDTDFNMDAICSVISNNLSTLKYFKLRVRPFIGTESIDKIIKLLSNGTCKYVLIFELFYDFDNVDYDRMKCDEFNSDLLEKIHNLDNHKKFYDENMLQNKEYDFTLGDFARDSKKYTQWYTLLKWCHSYGPNNYIKIGLSNDVELIFTNIEKNNGLIKNIC
jgi:hypothetical protein